MGELPPKDFDKWEPNIRAWSNWDGTVTLSHETPCPIGRQSCVTRSRPPYDDCEHFMGVRQNGTGCCWFLAARRRATKDGEGGDADPR